MGKETGHGRNHVAPAIGKLMLHAGRSSTIP